MSLLHTLATSVLALAALPLSATELLLPGDYHGSEIAAADGEHWFALHQDASGATHLELQPVAIIAVHDPIIDGEGEATGIRVAAEQDEALFFLRGNAHLVSGTIAMAYAADGDPLSLHDIDRQFRLFDRDAGRLSMHCDRARLACILEFAFEGRTQTLGQWPISTTNASESIRLGDDAWPHLRFAGDLDRDGRIDLLIDMTDHYNVSAPTLFLSSQAKDGELVGAAAELRSVGC